MIEMILRRGRLNLPDNTPKGVFVEAFGRKHSAPTGDVFLSLTAKGFNPPLRWIL